MENTFWTALATSSTAALVTSMGIYTIRNFVGWGQRNITYFMCFAAGMLISASFLHIVPKSLAMNANAPIYLLVGFFTLLFSRISLSLHSCAKEILEKSNTGLDLCR